MSIPASKNSKEAAVTLMFIFKGYKESFYYWELVIFTKKILLLFIGSFNDFFPNESKATILLVLICIFLLLHVRVLPYENRFLNQIEFLSLLVTFLTANFGMLLYSDDLNHPSIFFLLVIINLLMLCFWIYVFAKLRMKSSKRKREKSKKKL